MYTKLSCCLHLVDMQLWIWKTWWFMRWVLGAMNQLHALDLFYYVIFICLYVYHFIILFFNDKYLDMIVILDVWLDWHGRLIGFWLWPIIGYSNSPLAMIWYWRFEVYSWFLGSWLVWHIPMKLKYLMCIYNIYIIIYCIYHIHISYIIYVIKNIMI